MTKSNTVAVAVTFTGKGKAARTAAFAKITDLSYAEDVSRAASLANMRVVLGNMPSDSEVRAAKEQWIIGRVASRLPASKVPLVSTADQRIARASDLVCFYAAPPKEGSQPRKLRANQKGRRTVAEHKIVRAAEEACSVFFAELGLTGAKTTAERKETAKAKRAPSMAGSGKGQAKPEAPSHAQLVKPAAPTTADDAVNHVMTQGAALLAYGNKHAKLIPADIGAAIVAFKAALNKASNAYAEAKAAKEAKA